MERPKTSNLQVNIVQCYEVKVIIWLLKKFTHSMSIIRLFFSQRVKLLSGAEHSADQIRERNQNEGNERGVFEEFARHGRTEG